jgi:hypothetical protein
MGERREEEEGEAPLHMLLHPFLLKLGKTMKESNNKLVLG